MDYHIKPRISEKRIVGPALTVDVPEDDGGFIPTAIEALEAGQVLVIAGKGFSSSSYWGDHRSLCAQMKGAEGVVIDGLFRDLEGCREIGLPIFSEASFRALLKRKIRGSSMSRCSAAVWRCGPVTLSWATAMVSSCCALKKWNPCWKRPAVRWRPRIIPSKK